MADNQQLEQSKFNIASEACIAIQEQLVQEEAIEDTLSLMPPETEAPEKARQNIAILKDHLVQMSVNGMKKRKVFINLFTESNNSLQNYMMTLSITTDAELEDAHTDTLEQFSVDIQKFCQAIDNANKFNAAQTDEAIDLIGDLIKSIVGESVLRQNQERRDECLTKVTQLEADLNEAINDVQQVLFEIAENEGYIEFYRARSDHSTQNIASSKTVMQELERQSAYLGNIIATAPPPYQETSHRRKVFGFVVNSYKNVVIDQTASIAKAKKSQVDADLVAKYGRIATEQEKAADAAQKLKLHVELRKQLDTKLEDHKQIVARRVESFQQAKQELERADKYLLDICVGEYNNPCIKSVLQLLGMLQRIRRYRTLTGTPEGIFLGSFTAVSNMLQKLDKIVKHRALLFNKMAPKYLQTLMPLTYFTKEIRAIYSGESIEQRKQRLLALTNNG